MSMLKDLQRRASARLRIALVLAGVMALAGLFGFALLLRAVWRWA